MYYYYFWAEQKIFNKLTFGDPSFAMPTSDVAIPFTLPSSWYKIY
jgi:hypothetical protein